ncbi:MAG: hypothetical protein GKR88_11330 [Flavobacteriaceae bacterium]|nr:MAG: hypothetical protein GKR88_11330 [Flavobacteriaceae bacterium]
MENEIQPFEKIRNIIELYKTELQKKETEMATLTEAKEKASTESFIKEETIASKQQRITELLEQVASLTEMLEKSGLENDKKDEAIKTLNDQITDLTLEKEKGQRILKVVSNEKTELVKNFDSKVKEKADSTAIRLLKQPYLIPRYITELQKRKAIELKEGEEMLKMAQMMQGINEKTLESKEQALETKDLQLSIRIERQDYEIEKNFTILTNITKDISMERKEWGLQKKEDLLSIREKRFEISKQSTYNEISTKQIQLFQKEVNLQLDTKNFDIQQREKFVTLLQKELQIDRKNVLNEVVEKAFDLKKRKTELQLSYRESELSIKEKEAVHNQKVNLFKLIEKEFSLKKQRGLLELMQYGFDIKQERTELENQIKQEEFSKDKRLFEISKRELEAFNAVAESQINLMKSKLENERQLLYLDINRGKNTNENNKRLLEIDKAMQAVKNEVTSVKFSRKEIEQFAKDRDLQHTEKVLNLKKDILTGFQDTYLNQQSYDIKKSYRALGFGVDSPYQEESYQLRKERDELLNQLEEEKGTEE